MILAAGIPDEIPWQARWLRMRAPYIMEKKIQMDRIGGIKKMKKRLAMLLALLLVVSGASALAQAPEMPGGDGMTRISRPERVVDRIGLQLGSTIIVGTTTPMTGVFGTDLLVGTTADMDVRDLLEGYRTIAPTRMQEMVFDGTAVQSVNTTQEANGDRTYTIQLTEGLTYNDGSPVTSKDYLFSVLLSSSPVLSELNIAHRGYDHIVGIDAFRAGDVNLVAGLRYVSDLAFTIRIAGRYLPYFYGMEMLNITPYPMQVIAPGCDILDYGDGVFIGPAEAAEPAAADLPYTPGQFGAEMLRETLLNPQTGYVYNPRVTAGPYQLEAFNPVTNHATLVVNGRYRGNFEGQSPHIERIEFRLVRNETMMGMLRDGEIDLLNKVSNLTQVNEGLELADTQRQVNRAVYPRSGLAFLSFATEQGVTADASVRKAISRAVDREKLIEVALGVANGVSVHGYYGIGQWMINTTFPADPETGSERLVVQEIVEALKYDYGMEEAKNFLVQGGWTLNATGGPFAEGVDDIRHMNADGNLIPLMINWVLPVESAVAQVLKVMLQESFTELGIGLRITEMPMSEMLRHYFRETERTFDMFFLASNFGSVFDPYYDFHTGDEFQGQLNATGLRDEELMNLALQMRTTNPADARKYVEAWIEFQHRFAELMPVAPLYSNVYFDFFPLDLQDYNIMQHPSWAPALLYAWFGDAPLEEGDSEYVELLDE